MSKVSDYNFVYDIQLQAFKDEIRQLWNYGKYGVPVVTTPPTWTASIGEEVYLMPTTGGTSKYVFRNTAWVSVFSVAA